MKRLTSADYDTAVKKDLLAEVTARQAEGRTIELNGNTVADLIAALQADDEAGEAKKEPEQVLPQDLKLKAVAAHDGETLRQVPGDLDQFSGQYKYREPFANPVIPGEVWGLKILPANKVRGGKTHHAKSAARFWDGTEEQFREQFDKI